MITTLKWNDAKELLPRRSEMKYNQSVRVFMYSEITKIYDVGWFNYRGDGSIDSVCFDWASPNIGKVTHWAYLETEKPKAKIDGD